MQRVIVNEWRQIGDSEIESAQILRHDAHPEGLNFSRVRFQGKGLFTPPLDSGTLASVLAGEAVLACADAGELRMAAGTHVYLPPGSRASFRAYAGAELALVQSPSAARARGDALVLRDDQFLAACAQPGLALRWILTPQYLSRRVFLHHDRTLTSRTGDPLSWFHTTMFDVEGLPENDEGLPAFKMSYNYRTEPNICYDVAGKATVRMAKHPYSKQGQEWGPWQVIDDQTTYHLGEAATEAEWHQGPSGRKPRRNKHEIRIVEGHVSLMCMHDPAPTGAERHAAGEYSEYGDLALTLGTPDYKEYLEQLQSLDQMVDALSMAKARGDEKIDELPQWADYQAGLAAQRGIESELEQGLVAAGHGREAILRAWML